MLSVKSMKAAEQIFCSFLSVAEEEEVVRYCAGVKVATSQ